MALGVNLRGDKELLGLWIEQNEGAKFWLHVLTELKNRGVGDIFIACCDGLSGFPQAIETVYPRTQVQLCIVHMVRNSLTYVSWKHRKQVAKDLDIPGRYLGVRSRWIASQNTGISNIPRSAGYGAGTGTI